jgi:hypothetical protein
METSKIKYYFISILLSAILIYSVLIFHFHDQHQKNSYTIYYEAGMQLISWIWIWMLPILLLTFHRANNKRIKRLLIGISPVIITCFYFYSLLTQPDCENDFRLFAGYFYRFPYFIDMIIGVILSSIIQIILTEFMLSRAVKKEAKLKLKKQESIIKTQ